MFVKTLRIENRRLRICHALLTVVFLVVGVVQFHQSSHYAVTVDAAPSMWIHIDPLDPDDDAWLESRSSPLCSDPNSEIKCAPWCPPFTRDVSCLSLFDLFRPSETRLLLVSFMRQFTLPTPAYEFPLYFDEWWVPMVEFLSVSIQYGFTADISGHSDSQFVAGPKRIAGSSSGSGGTPLATVVLDSHGKVWRTVPPGSLTLSFREIAYLIGDEHFLDATNSLATEEAPAFDNRTRRPPVRKTGIQIEFVVFCSSRDPTQEFEARRFWTAQPQTCTLKLRQKKKSAEMEHSFDFLRGGTVSREVYGIGITGVAQGQFEFPSMGATLSNLVIFLVFLSLPTQITRFVAVHCLGDLSRIYRDVLVQKFDIRDEVASKALRLAGESVTYAAIDTLSQEREGNSVTMKCLSERMQVALSSMQCLDKSEVQSLAHFSMRRVAERGQQCCTARRDILGWASATSPPESVSAQDHVPIASLLGAESSADPVRIQALATLFDKDRNVSFMERCFTPTSLWNSIHAAKMATDVEQRAETHSNVVGRALADDLEEDSCSASQERSEATELRQAGAVAHNLGDDLEKGNPSPLQKRLEANELRLAFAEKQIYTLQSQRREFEAILDNIKTHFQHVYGCSDNLGCKPKPGVSSIGSSSASQAYTAPHSPSALPSAEGNRSLLISAAPLATSSTTLLSQGPHAWANASEPQHVITKLSDIQVEAQDDVERLSARVKRIEQGSQLARVAEEGALKLEVLWGGSCRDSRDLGDSIWNEVGSRTSGSASRDTRKTFLTTSSPEPHQQEPSASVHAVKRLARDLEHVEAVIWHLEHRVESLESWTDRMKRQNPQSLASSRARPGSPRLARTREGKRYI